MLQRQNITSSMTGAALVTMKTTQEIHSQTYRENIDRIGNGATSVNVNMDHDVTRSDNTDERQAEGDSDLESAGGAGGDEWSANSSGEQDEEDRMPDSHINDLSAAEYVCFNDIFGDVDGEDGDGGVEGHSSNIQPSSSSTAPDNQRAMRLNPFPILDFAVCTLIEHPRKIQNR